MYISIIIINEAVVCTLMHTAQLLIHSANAPLHYQRPFTQPTSLYSANVLRPFTLPTPL